jgi:hypothetical protein
VPEGSPDHHAPTQIQTLAHRPAAAGGHQINGTINVTNPDTVVLGMGIATLMSNGGNVGWTTNTAVNGLMVNGANVTMYGLAVEHYQAVQVQWNGTNSGVVSANALTSPTSSRVQWHDMVTVSLGGVGTISHLIDNAGGTVNSGSTVTDLTSYN